MGNILIIRIKYASTIKYDKTTDMDKLFCYIIMIFCAISINAQSLPKGINETKVNIEAKVLVKRFCNCIVDVGTSSKLNGYSISVKRKKIKYLEQIFYNYREDPRIMNTSWSDGSQHKQPIYRYMNNLLLQADLSNSTQMKKYEIALDGYYVGTRTKQDNWVQERRLHDGSILYSKTFRFHQIYRVIDILNRNSELRNREGEVRGDDYKYIKVYAIYAPNGKCIGVRLGDINLKEF